MRRTVGVTLERDRGHGDDGRGRKPVLEVVVARLTGSDTEAPPVIVDDDVDVVRVVERRRAPVERLVVEVPLWRRRVPDELGEVVAVLVIAGPTALGRRMSSPRSGRTGARRWCR